VAPPPAVTVAVYALPAVPEGSDVVVIPRATVIVKVTELQTGGVAESQTIMVTVGSLAARMRPATAPPPLCLVLDSVPEITPVLVFSVSPAGRLPPLRLQVNGGVPPESRAPRLQLYAAPAAPAVQEAGRLLGAGRLGDALTLNASDADFVELATEAALMLTAPVELGAVNVAAQVWVVPLTVQAEVEKAAAAHAAPPNVQVQVTPLSLESLVTVAVTLSDWPSSRPLLELGETATEIGAAACVLRPPELHPEKSTTAPSAAQISRFMEPPRVSFHFLLACLLDRR
jgi:hypothetical protein